MNNDPNGNFPWLIVAILAICTIGGGLLGASSDEKLGELGDKKDTDSSIDVATPDGTQESPPLTRKDRAKNIFIGASLGLAVGGLVVATAGAAAAVAAGSAAVYVAAFGLTGAQTFAWGALAYNFVAIVSAPFLGLEMEPIEVTP